MTMTESAVSTGRAPGGMWWVAWRQHRIQLAIAVGLMAIGAVTMVIFRVNLVADLTAAGCTDVLNRVRDAGCPSPGGGELFYDGNLSYRTWYYSLIMPAAFGLPLLLGVFLGATIFPREFEQGTHVYALSQSVSRARWWAVKVTMLAVPLVVGLLALGLIKEWVDSSTAYTAYSAMGSDAFPTRSIMPAAFGLAVFVAAVAAGIFTRRTVVALVVSLIVGLAVMATLASPLRVHLVPADRSTWALTEDFVGIADPTAQDPDVVFVDSGYLDKDGHELSYRDVNGCFSYKWDPALSQVENSDRQDQEWHECLAGQGVVAAYNDMVPGTMLWSMRLIVTGIFLALSVLLLAAGAWRLRAAVAKR